MFSRMYLIVLCIFFYMNSSVLFAIDCADMFKKFEPSKSLAYLTMLRKPSDDKVETKLKQIDLTYSSLIQFINDKISETSSQDASTAPVRKNILENLVSKLEKYYEQRTDITFFQNNELTNKEMFDLLNEAKVEWEVEDSSQWYYFMTFFNDIVNQVKDGFNSKTPEEALILANELDVSLDYNFENLITDYDQQIQDLLYIIFGSSNPDPKMFGIDSNLSSDELYTETSIMLKKIIAIYALQTLKNEITAKVTRLIKGSDFTYETVTELLYLTKKLELVDEDEDIKSLDGLKKTRRQIHKAEEDRVKKLQADENKLLASFYGTSKEFFARMNPIKKGEYKAGLKIALRVSKMGKKEKASVKYDRATKGMNSLAHRLGFIGSSVDDNYSEDIITDCTGVVVSPNTVLTSARCVEQLGQTGVVLIGDVNVELEDKVIKYKDATSVAYYINPLFIKEGSHIYDLAVVRFPEGTFKERLHSKVNLSATKVEGICVSVQDDDYSMDKTKIPNPNKYEQFLLKDGAVVFGPDDSVVGIRSFINRFALMSQNESFLRWVMKIDSKVEINGMD